jgi:hypothetical protein
MNGRNNSIGPCIRGAPIIRHAQLRRRLRPFLRDENNSRLERAFANNRRQEALLSGSLLGGKGSIAGGLLGDFFAAPRQCIEVTSFVN